MVVSPSALRLLVTELREAAERCLSTESPTHAEVHELASRVLGLVAILDAHAGELGAVGPAMSYRVPAAETERDTATAVVALERALAACEARLATALHEIAELRARS